MKSFSINSAVLFVCISALVQVWAAPVEAQVAETNQVNSAAVNPATAEQAFNDWYNAVYQQYARPLVARDTESPAQFPPFPPFPPPPTFPPFPPFPPGRC